jgi:hypothetical protein
VHTISESDTPEGIAEFWDSHSLADYWDQTHEVAMETKAQRRHRVTIDPDVYARIEEQARQRGLLPETLIHVWLVERLEQVA